MDRNTEDRHIGCPECGVVNEVEVVKVVYGGQVTDENTSATCGNCDALMENAL